MRIFLTVFLILLIQSRPAIASNGLLDTLRNRDKQTPAADNSLLVFSSDRSGSQEIWTTDLDGSNPRKLTGETGDKTDPGLSPDGNHVVYVNRHPEAWELWIVSIDGTNPRKLTSLNGFIRNPSWSRDEKRIVFSFAREEEPFHPNSIREIHLETQKIQTLLESKDPGEAGVTWFLNYPVYTPDQSFLFHTRAEISTPGFPKYTAVGIFKTDLNDEKTTSIVGGSFYYDEGGTVHGHWGTSPVLCDQDLPLVFVSIVGYTEGSICFSSLDGKRVRRILSEEGVMYRNPAVSAAGRYIYYEKAVGDTSQIFRLDTDRGESGQVTSEGNNRSPDL